jgi:hypothetical protein
VQVDDLDEGTGDRSGEAKIGEVLRPCALLRLKPMRGASTQKIGLEL